MITCDIETLQFLHNNIYNNNNRYKYAPITESYSWFHPFKFSIFGVGNPTDLLFNIASARKNNPSNVISTPSGKAGSQGVTSYRSFSDSNGGMAYCTWERNVGSQREIEWNTEGESDDDDVWEVMQYCLPSHLFSVTPKSKIVCGGDEIETNFHKIKYKAYK